MSKDNALLIFVKAPKPGQVKTRLQTDLSTDEALLLYKAMVEDLVARFRNVVFCDIKILYWPVNTKEQVQKWLGYELAYFPQTGTDLGWRMHNSFVWAFAQNFRRVVIVGSDIPTLERSTVTSAFEHMEQYDVVIGPSDDGGYYLIGLNEPHPELFTNIVWSTNTVLADTLEKIRTEKLSVHQLATKTDVDTFHDVVRLWRKLKETNEQLSNQKMLNTYNILNKIFAYKSSEIKNELV